MTDLTRHREDRIAALQYDYASREKHFIECCNLCGSRLWTILTHRDRYGFPAQTVCCECCGLVMLNPRMTAEGYREFYSSVYRPLVSAYYGRIIDAQTIQREQQAYAEEMEHFLAPFLPKRRERTFLDIGGSTGVVAAHFSRRFHLHGTIIDPAPDEIAEAKALGIETIEGFIENWNPQGMLFDVIGMFQTIDHLLDVMATLSKARSLLASDGLLIADIVDFRAAYLKSGNIEQATKIDHPYYLVEETAEAFFARAGFKPVRRAYSDDHHLVAWICRPCEPRNDALPPDGFATSLRREVRFVQNAPLGLRRDGK